MTTRIASHAGSWYTDHGPTLKKQLEEWLAAVDATVAPPGARIIIAPHAGYSYSGPAAAWAYKSLDLAKAKRVFLLGPSHHKYLSGCTLSKHARYTTPIGDLPLDTETIHHLKHTAQFDYMSTSTDEAEHSLEMHLPYLRHVLSNSFDDKSIPPLVPILVGNTSPAVEKTVGAFLAPYLSDPENVFVVSSDFCHWGSRFGYTFYVPSTASSVAQGKSLSRKDSPSDPPIFESIARVDKAAMQAIETGSHDEFLQNLRETENTVCGRHPIGVIMAAIEASRAQGKVGQDKGLFKFVRYERSSEVTHASDSSVSYASAYATL